MCRSIKRLRTPEGPATDDEIAEAALQYVRKISGFRAPTQRHQAVFDAAVAEVAGTSRRLLAEIDARLKAKAH